MPQSSTGLLPGAALAAAMGAILVGGCAAHRPAPQAARPIGLRLDPSYQPRRVGRGPDYRPPATGAAVRSGRTLGAGDGSPLACRAPVGARVGVHVELFAAGRVVVVPAGIGIAPPTRREGARVLGGRCSYPLRTTEPTGVLEVDPGRRLALGDLFAVWGQPLSGRRLIAFRAHGARRVAVWVNGRRWVGDPRALPLTRHAQIVLELGARVAPHRLYLFPPDL